MEYILIKITDTTIVLKTVTSQQTHLVHKPTKITVAEKEPKQRKKNNLKTAD
ncbi:uncharacterized protein BX663DRAFT_500546 [Cokeromyces recurvatus]|uniref:uncharacterized protein n=1 Tax=Cokeromyces recurvatus TaxID=90255 RepID=UPI00221F8E9B|nr:uncharacterized protein BX663DRAFT_500546 [Cokeromyces recurvatus]KAI7905676.1 hypothetical protein BX663DRAFT_500546 [Cokeromyces recurvatus]